MGHDIKPKGIILLWIALNGIIAFGYGKIDLVVWKNGFGCMEKCI